MSVISEFSAKMDAHNKAVDNAIGGISQDISNLKKDIAELSSRETISEDDKTILSGIEAKAGVIEEKLAALDALTPPATPPVTLPPT